jgi:hypothetical protein
MCAPQDSVSHCEPDVYVKGYSCMPRQRIDRVEYVLRFKISNHDYLLGIHLICA